MLEYKVTEVPAELSEHYKEQDGAYVLDVTGIETDNTELETAQTDLSDAKQKLGEFRTTNANLMKQIKNSGGNVDDNFNVDIDTAINDALAPIKDSNTKLKDENARLQSTLEEVVLSDKVKDIAIKHGVFESALSDVVSRAKQIFTVKDGKTIPKDSKNSRDADGNVLDTESWLKGLSESASHLFKPSGGSGAKPAFGGKFEGDRTSTQKINDGLKNLKT